MKIIDVQQGSDLWHEHRRTHFNASDAPAMMGCSPYKTRAQLLREIHTGLSAPVDDATQERFDNGHRYEALARPVAEKLILDDLYPITVAAGRLSASLDGATLDGSVLFEHKTLSQELRECMEGEDEADRLPLHYRVQMEQQLHCSGAERVLFMASKWADDDTLIEERHCWYYPDMALRQQIIAGWAQFEQDLAAYVPAEAAPAVTAAPQEQLPAVSVQVSGALSVASNLAPFGVALRQFIAKIPARPSTDQEFADTEAACKRLKEAEDRLRSAEDSALASMADVNELRRTVAELRELARATRLASERLVKQRKEQIREEEVRRGTTQYLEHVKALQERVGVSLAYASADWRGPGFAEAIKGLKTLDSVRNAIDTELARAKIDASAIADRIQANIKLLTGDAHDWRFLFPDLATVASKSAEDFANLLTARIAAHNEAQAKRRAAEEAARLASEALRQSAIEAQATVQKIAAAPVVFADTPKPLTPQHAALTDSPPTLTLGTIQDRLGFMVSADFLTRLGFTYTQVKASKCYQVGDFKRICAAIAEHCLKVGEGAR